MTLALDDGSSSWERGCRDKHRFFTVSEAKKIAKKRTKATGRRLYPYACAHCLGAHITSKPPDRLTKI